MLQTVKIEEILPVVIEAGNAVMEIYKQSFKVELKDDRSPLTKADKRSNEILIKRLQNLYPEIPFITEESKHTHFEQRRAWEYLWLIDPLDGTKEFIKHNGEFTINVALIRRGEPVLGVIYVPDKNIIYYSKEGNGSFKMDVSGSTQQIYARKKPALSKLVVVGSRSHASDDLYKFIKQQELKYDNVELISRGSSLKFCLVAEGLADLYLRTGPTMEWDTAAGHAVVIESGKQVYHYRSNEILRYNKENLRNDWFIVK
jgi:3'(2'), 5'-bisphosphate nucleotidase